MPAIEENYTLPVSKGGRYTKFEDGKSVDLRVLNTITTGWQYFNTENKPVRSRDRIINPIDIGEGKFGKYAVKHIWVLTVYNYSTKQVEIANISQTIIQRALLALEQNPKWGSLLEYDITITRTNDGDRVNYVVTPNKPELFSEEIDDITNIDIDAYFRGENPFTEEA